ncbi:alanine:cation symporter family protein [Peribacillus sp. NPDC006672]|uniref:alanine:cation symporter family protein n=1 Tax=Peribacillus sp. NPDC006672 TaxID=3390606 RepID=UPI003CFDA66B
MRFALPGVQSNAIASSIKNAFDLPPLISGIVITLLTGLIIMGGVKRIAKVAEIIVPFMAIAFIMAAVFIVAMNINKLPSVFTRIFGNAFTLDSTFSGIIGSAIAWGVKRGMYSSEAGQGTGPVYAAAANVFHPVKQGLVQAFAIYIDTLFVCSATAFMILITGMYNVEDGKGGYIVIISPILKLDRGINKRRLKRYLLD